MKKFIKRLLLFGVIFISHVMIVIFILSSKYDFSLKDLPVPNISNSYSFNNKINFMRNKKADIITIGSSMSLNNLNSNLIVEKFKTDSYLNYSSWGLNCHDIYSLLKIISARHKPSTLIVSSYLRDFMSIDKKFDTKQVSSYLNSSKTWCYHFKKIELSYYLENYKLMKKYKNKHNYMSLIYDKYGATIFYSKNFEISKNKMNDLSISGDLRKENYNYLDSISFFCYKQNIKLLFFQSPLRQKIFKQIDSSIITKHINKIYGILKRRNQIFVNSNEILWNDDLFVDATHFNSKGAEKYTKYCLQKVEIK